MHSSFPWCSLRGILDSASHSFCCLKHCIQGDSRPTISEICYPVRVCPGLHGRVLSLFPSFVNWGESHDPLLWVPEFILQCYKIISECSFNCSFQGSYILSVPLRIYGFFQLLPIILETHIKGKSNVNTASFDFNTVSSVSFTYNCRIKGRTSLLLFIW